MTRPRFRRAFTLIELLVVLAIILVIAAVTLSSQSSFNRTLTLANTAYDLGLAIRSAETYGIGSRTIGLAANIGYGVHFDATSAAARQSFILFADDYPATAESGNCHGVPQINGQDDPNAPNAQPGDCAYTSGSGKDALINTYAFGNGITVKDFCSYDSFYDSWSCASSPSNSLSTLDIVFARPNPDVFISTNGSYNGNISQACITLTAPAGGDRYVSVTSSGEVNSRATSCP